jgi:hypothetical protein
MDAVLAAVWVLISRNAWLPAWKNFIGLKQGRKEYRIAEMIWGICTFCRMYMNELFWELMDLYVTAGYQLHYLSALFGLRRSIVCILILNTTCFCTGGKQQQGCICPTSGWVCGLPLKEGLWSWTSRAGDLKEIHPRCSWTWNMLVSCSAALVAQSWYADIRIGWCSKWGQTRGGANSWSSY